MFCKKCGKQITDGAKFCNACGTPVTQTSASEFNSKPDAYPKQTQNDAALRGYGSSAGTVTSSEASERGTTLLAVAFLLAAATMFCMIMSGTTISAMNYGFSGINTTLSSTIGSQFGAYVVFTVFLVIYIIVNIFAVFLIFKRNRFGIIIGLIANLLAVISGIIAICASFGLADAFIQMINQAMGSSVQRINGIISSHPTVWTWFALALALADGAFLAVKGKEII